MQFSFVDVVEGPGQDVGNPIGPLVDDVLVTGWKYGPVRSMAASKVGTDFRVTWARPYNSLNETVGDTRTLSYRVWRSPAGADTWTELTTSRLGDGVTSYDDPILIEGQPFEYLVQAWDPGAGTGYGAPVKSGSVSVPAADPILTLSAPTTGFTVGTGP